MATKKSTQVPWTAALDEIGACSDAVAFARQHRTFRAAWVACERPDWLLWWAAKCIGEPGSETHKTLVRVACACAWTALRHVPAGETRPLKAIKTAEAWCEGKATLQEVRAAYTPAASAYAAASASYAAASAASAVYAAASAASAAYAAADAAAAYHPPLLTSRRALCDLIRQTYPTPPRRPRASARRAA